MHTVTLAFCIDWERRGGDHEIFRRMLLAAVTGYSGRETTGRGQFAFAGYSSDLSARGGGGGLPYETDRDARRLA